MTTMYLSARGLAAGYHNHTVIRGIDLDITAEGVTAIVGANACSKSTRMRTLSRLLRDLNAQHATPTT